jgi:hypothetical protein
MKKIIVISAFLFFAFQAAAQTPYSYLSMDDAHKTAKFLQQYSEIMIFCGCCKDAPAKKTIIKYKKAFHLFSGYGKYYKVVYEGIAPDNKAFKEDLKLENIFVNIDGNAVNVAKHLGISNIDPCVEPFKW